jgi:hypothetical protein
MKRNLGGPALVLAAVALFVALGQAAVAAGIVPLARHAITAGTATNALKLGGKTPAQLKTSLRGAQGPQGPQGPKGDAGPQGPSGSSTVSVHTQTFTLSEGGTSGDSASITANCGSGQKVVGGGFDATAVLSLGSKPTSGGDGWTVSVNNLDGSQSQAGTVYALCLG